MYVDDESVIRKGGERELGISMMSEIYGSGGNTDDVVLCAGHTGTASGNWGMGNEERKRSLPIGCRRRRMCSPVCERELEERKKGLTVYSQAP